MSSPGSFLLFYIAGQQDSFGAYDQSYLLRSLLFRLTDGVNCVYRRVYLGDCPETE